MSDKDKCKLIIVKMTEAGIPDMVSPDTVDDWNQEELDYHIANYDSWIKE